MDSDKFEIDEQTAKILADSLEKSIALDVKERDDLDKRILIASGKLKELRKRFKLGNVSPTPRTGGKKLGKGEGSRKVEQFFKENPTKAFTIAEITKLSAMPFSSVRNILTRETGKYRVENDLWCLR